MAETGEEINEDKDRLEGLRFISETHRSARRERRKIETKVFFTAITFYSAILTAKFTGKLKLPQSDGNIFELGTWAVLILVAILSSVHLLGLEAANKVNRELSQNAEMEIMRIIDIPKPTKAGKWIAEAHYWKISMIIILAISTGITISSL